MKVSIIIPVYRDWDVLQNCLNDLSIQTYSQANIEIIVVNNEVNSMPPKELILPSNSKILTEATPGSYAARNRGLKEASGEVVAFTDSDCRPQKDWVEEGIKALSEGYDLIGGEVELFKESDGDQLAFIYEKKFGFNQKRNAEMGRSVTANLFCKRAVIKRTGEFRQDLMSGGDYEWTKKATSLGFKLNYGAKVIVKHPARKKLKNLISKKKRTIGGMYSRFFKSYSAWEKLKFTLKMIRPHITIFNYKDLSLKERFQLFFATWYVECIGMKEMLLLDLSSKKAERA